MTPRKIALNRGRDPMDHWLDSKGFYRKHIARDGSCLFRAVAEQVCTCYVLLNSHFF